MEKCIECGSKKFKEGNTWTCKDCGETYSDEEATLAITKAIDEATKHD